MFPWEGTATRADPGSAPRTSGPQRTEAAQTERRAEALTRALTHVEWSERFEKHQPWHTARSSRLRAAARAAWGGTVESGTPGDKARVFMACQLFHSKGHFSLDERF